MFLQIGNNLINLDLVRCIEQVDKKTIRFIFVTEQVVNQISPDETADKQFNILLDALKNNTNNKKTIL